MNFNPLKKISLLFLSGILLFSCSSDKLDRSKAEELIKQEFKYPNVEFTRFSLELLGSNRYQPLYNQGLLRKPSGWAMAVMVTSQGASYTPNGNQPGEFASSCFFATNVREFNEITGIVFEDENESKAKIEFNVKRKSITPFGEFLDYNEVDLIDYTVEAARYDDGWRIINQDDNVNYSPKDFEHIFGSLSHSSVDNDIKNSIEITNESGTSPCLLKDILVENGNYYILVDYTQITGEDENSGAPIYANNNPKLRTFKITNNSKVTILEMGIQEKKIHISDKDKEELVNYTMWDIEVNNGNVVSLSQQYFP